MSQGLVTLVMVLPVILFSLTIHEVSHGYVAFLMGDPTAKASGRLSLNPIKHLDPIGTLFPIVMAISGMPAIGWAKPVPINPHYFKDPRRGMMFVGFAGPLSNFVMAFAAAMVAGLTFNGGGFFFQMAMFALTINVALGIFNLIPVPPLDGSRVVSGLLSPALNYKYMKLEKYGLLIMIVMFMFFRGLLFAIISPAINGISNLMLSAFRLFG